MQIIDFFYYETILTQATLKCSGGVCWSSRSSAKQAIVLAIFHRPKLHFGHAVQVLSEKAARDSCGYTKFQTIGGQASKGARFAALIDLNRYQAKKDACARQCPTDGLGSPIVLAYAWMCGHRDSGHYSKTPTIYQRGK